MEIHMFGIRKSEYIFSCSFLFFFFEHLLFFFFMHLFNLVCVIEETWVFSCQEVVQCLRLFPKMLLNGQRSRYLNLDLNFYSVHHHCLKCRVYLLGMALGFMGFPADLDSRESAWNSGDLDLIPGSGRSPREGNGNPLQYSCLENLMDQGAWWATVLGVTELDTTKWLTHTFGPYSDQTAPKRNGLS